MSHATTRNQAALATVLPGHRVEIVFKKGVNYAELVRLQQLEVGGVIALGECAGAISLVLGNRGWRDDAVSSRTFCFYITEQYTFDDFRASLPTDLFESIKLVD